MLSTLHPSRGVDAVPVVYAVIDDRLGIPIDTVKAKQSTKLQRVRNLEGDPRATLLIQNWDAADWSRLWWVRAQLRWMAEDIDAERPFADRLAERYSQYSDRPFARVLVFEIVGLTGWDAAD